MAAPPLAAPPFALDQTFKLHSNLGASKKIYLDFDGNVFSGTLWNINDNGGADFTMTGYTLDGDNTTFNDAEKERIQRIWQRVAEDFFPFDVDVTTEEPPQTDLDKAGGGDTRWGKRVVIGSNFSPLSDGAGGLAYVGSFGQAIDTPALVFFQNLAGGAEKSVAEAITHETGHTLGLTHDGRTVPVEEYYGGHGAGPTGWAPIMGVGYDQNLTQWSKGEYANANNTQDDLQIITTANGFGYRTDDFGNSTGAAALLVTTQAGAIVSPDQYGIISQRGDIDYFSFTAGPGALTINIDGAYGTNLDISATLYGFNGVVLATSNPTDALNATLTYTVTATATFYISIDGVGKGTAFTGYTDYGSLGQYHVTGSFNESGPTPELDIFDGVTAVADGGSVDFGNQYQFYPAVVKTLTLRNTGSGTLVLSPATLTGTGFTLLTNFTLGQTVASGGSVTIQVQMDTTTLGAQSAVLSIPNSDPNENPYEINLSGFIDAQFAEISVADGVTDIPDGTGVLNFGSIAQGTGSVTKILTIRNTGTGDLLLQPATITGSGFVVLPNLSANQIVPAGGTTTLTVVMTATVPGTKTATISFANNDADEGPYNFTLTGIVIPGTYVEINVLNDGVNLPNNSGVVVFPTAAQGATVTKTISILNTGTSNLVLQPATIFSGSGFTVQSNFTVNQNVLPNQTATLTLRMDTATAGNKSVVIQFLNNDPDEGTYRVALSGSVTGTPAPEISVLDGATEVADNAGSVSFGSAPQATVVTKVLTIRNTGTGNLILQPASITGSGFTILTNFTANKTVAPNGVAELVVKMNTTTVGAKTGTISFANNDANENPYNFALTGTVTAATFAEVAVMLDVNELADNVGSVSFGTVNVGSAPLTKTFKIMNKGTGNLVLSPATLPDGSGFTIVQNFVAGQTVAPNQYVNLVVRMDTALQGSKNTTLSFANNDADENPFEIKLTGSVVVPSVIKIIDDGDAGFTTIGAWTPTSGGRGNDIRYATAGTGKTARWTFTDLLPGYYRVSATWLQATNRAVSTFNVRREVGGTAIITASLNQKEAPNDFTDQGSTWENIGVGLVTGNTLIVELSSAVTGYAIADAIRIERVGEAAPEISVTQNATNIADNLGSFSFGSITQGSAGLSKTFVIKNTGTANLVLQPATFTSGAGFTIVTNFTANQVVAPNATANLVVRLDSTTVGSKTATLSFLNNDADENPFNFTLTGQVTAAPAPVVNAAPTITNFGGNVTYSGIGNAVVTSGAVVTDSTSADFAGGSLTVNNIGGNSLDRVSLISGNGLLVSGSNLYVNGLLIGSFAGGNGLNPLVITFTNNANPARVSILVNQLRFSTTSLIRTARTLKLGLNDGDGGLTEVSKLIQFT